MPDKLKKLFGWLDFGGTIAGVGANILSTILTNRKNEQLAKMQNSFQKQENELAYQRAKPQNQVSQLMQAGMSKAGSLNAINGGATYQPVPITSATAQAPQIDLSSAFDGLMQIGENAKQRKMQEDLQDQQIKAAKDQQQAQIEFEREKLDFEKQKYDDEKELRDVNLEKLGLERDISRIEKDIADVVKDGRVNAENAENLARQSQAILDDIRSKRVTEAMARMTEAELDNLFELQATLNMLQQGLQYDSTSVVIKAVKKLGSFIGGAKGAGSKIRSH